MIFRRSTGKAVRSTMRVIHRLCHLVSYFEEKLIGYMVLAIMLLIYALLLCPSITRYTRKYKRYTKFKPLLIILLLILT